MSEITLAVAVRLPRKLYKSKIVEVLRVHKNDLSTKYLTLDKLKIAFGPEGAKKYVKRKVFYNDEVQKIIDILELTEDELLELSIY